MEVSQQAADSQWKQLLRLGKQLLEQQVPAVQCELIAKAVGELLSAKTSVWLASPAYLLPGIPVIETLPGLAATPLAHRALDKRAPQYEPQPSEDLSPTESAPYSAAVPMLVNDTLLGILQIDRPKNLPFSTHDLELVEGMVTHAAAVMETTRQEIINKWRFEQLALVRSVSAQIAHLTDLDRLCSHVTRLIQETFDYYYVAIFTLDEHDRLLRFCGSANRDHTRPLPPDFWLHLGDGMVGSAAESGHEIVAPDVHKEPRYRHLDLLPDTQAEASLPLKVENRILGVLDVQSNKKGSFHEVDMMVLRALADNISLAIESIHLYNSLERRVDQVSSVFEVSHALTSILNLDELLSEVVRLIRNRFGYPFVHVYTVHPGRRLVIYQAGTGERSEAMKEQARHYSLDAEEGLISWVARNGKTFLANNVALEPLYLPADLPPYDTQAELTVPLIAGEEVLGVLDIQSQEADAFDENDRSLFEALAAPIAIAMRNATLYRSEQWRRKVAESFRGVAQLISSSKPLNELLSYILEKLEEVLPCDASAIWLLEERNLPSDPGAQPRLKLMATRNIDVDKIFEVLQEKSVLDMLNNTLEAEVPVIRQKDSSSGPLGAALGFGPEYSSIAASMRTGKKPLGMVTLAHHQEGRYGSEAQAITATFASYAAVAIQNSRLYNESQEQALVSTMLLQVAEASQTTTNVDELLATMVRLTRLLMGVKKCAFLLWEDALQGFVLKAWYGFEPAPATDEQDTRVFAPQLPALKHLAAERSLDYLDDPGIEIDLPEMRLGSGTVLALPLLVRGELTGAFLVGLQVVSTSGVEPVFDPKALSILQGIAHQTSMTVDNLQLIEARQEEGYVTAALLQVSQAVATSSDLNDTLDTIVHLMPILVGIETCAIYLWDATNQLLRPTQVYAPSRREEETIRTRAFAPGENKMLDAIRESGSVYMCAIPKPDMAFEAWGSLDPQPYDPGGEFMIPAHGDWALGYPLSLKGQVLGIFLVREMTASAAFWERRLEIIHGIAQQTTMAIQNDVFRLELVQTERIEREIQLARQIQETFLPETLPRLSRWELDLRWETAREIGGDFYDIFKVGNNQWGLVIADVADKGLPAALYMTVSRTLIRASAANNPSPAKVLEEVNALLVNESNESMFVTAVYAILSLDTGEMIYANAGHNRPLLYRKKTGLVEQLPKGGTALGILDELKLENYPITIQPGDALILFTDGVTDIQNPAGEFFGEKRLEELVQAHGQETIQNMLEELDDAMIEFRRGVPPADDVTLLAIRREPPKRRKNKVAAEK